jgi:predicted nucleic acid-binding protein
MPTPLSAQLAASQITSLASLYRVADETSQVTNELLALIGQGLAAGKQVHDANIVATCLAYGIPRLLTHNLADFRRFGSLLKIESL